MPYAVQQAVRGHERNCVADGADENPALQRFACERRDPAGGGRLPLHAADQNQPGATFRQCRRVIIGRCAQSADRPDGLSVGRHVFCGVRTRTARHDARTKGRGEERRLPVCKFVEQDEYDLFFHNLIYKSVSTCRRIPLRRLRSAARRSENAPWRRPVPSCPRRRASGNFFRRRACSPRCSRSKWRVGR